MQIAGEVDRIVVTADRYHLVARTRFPATASRVVILCHPHPLYGGTMHNALIVSLAKHIAEKGGDEVGTLRFNYRGVEGSEGSFEDGRGESIDGVATIDMVRRDLPDARITMLGYSFGTWVAWQAARQHGDVDRVALIAPAMRLFAWESAYEGSHPPTEILVGEKDDLVSVTEARRLASSIGARLHIIDGADHFFLRQRRVVGTTLLPFLAPEIGE